MCASSWITGISWQNLVVRVEGTLVISAYDGRADALFRIFGPEGCLESTRMNGLIPFHGLIWVLYGYVNSCRKMSQLHRKSAP